MTPSSAPDEPTNSPGSQQAATGAGTRGRLLLLLLFTSTLLFAGLWLREKRLGLEQRPLPDADGTGAALQAQLRTWQAQAYERQQELHRANNFVGMVADPRTLSFQLEGKEGRGQVFVDEASSRLALFAFDLEPIEAPRGYQAWVRAGDGRMRSLGILPAPQGGVRALLVPVPPEGARAVEVTLEPRPGGETPAGEVVLRGEASSADLPMPGSPVTSPSGL